jgi:hypothetical protein
MKRIFVLIATGAVLFAQSPSVTTQQQSDYLTAWNNLKTALDQQAADVAAGNAVAGVEEPVVATAKQLLTAAIVAARQSCGGFTLYESIRHALYCVNAPTSQYQARVRDNTTPTVGMLVSLVVAPGVTFDYAPSYINTDGKNTTWQLAGIPVHGVTCLRNGKLQIAGTDYTLSGSVISSPSWIMGDVITCEWQ